MDVLIGCSGFPYSKKNYFQNFSFVEIEETYQSFLKGKTLKKLREQAGEDFSFSLRVPLFISDHQDIIKKNSINVPQVNKDTLSEYGMFKATKENLELLELFAKEVSDVEADSIIFHTSNKVYPTPENIKNMNYFFNLTAERFKESKIDIFWHSLGFWDSETINEAIHKTPVIPAFDPIMDDYSGNFDVMYYIMRGLGFYSKGYPNGALEQLASKIIKESVDSYVVFQGQYQASDAKRLLEIME
ncbi:DUF72 domain-containing protein [bacterium]|nr:DUF72 domain-containing protein [bacterium]